MITDNNILAEKTNLQYTINDINSSERLLKISRSHDRNYVSAMFFRCQIFFSDNEKKWAFIGVFECDEFKYDHSLSMFFPLFV